MIMKEGAPIEPWDGTPEYGQQLQQPGTGHWYTYVGPAGQVGATRYNAACKVMGRHPGEAGGFLINGCIMVGAWWMRGQEVLPPIESLNIELPRLPNMVANPKANVPKTQPKKELPPRSFGGPTHNSHSRKNGQAVQVGALRVPEQVDERAQLERLARRLWGDVTVIFPKDT